MKKRQLGIVVGCVAILLIGIGTKFYLWNHDNDAWRDDLTPIIDRFSVFAKVERGNWKSGVIGSGFGPSSYWLKGFLFMPLDEIREQYSWSKVDGEPIKIETPPAELEVPQDSSWERSVQLEQFVFMPGYVGEIYFDFEHSLVYFYAETN